MSTPSKLALTFISALTLHTLSSLAPMSACAESDLEREVARLRAKVAALELELSQRPRDAAAYPVPTQLTFCGQTIDLTGAEVRRRFEEELLRVLNQRKQVGLYLKRALTAFPVIEREAAALKVCPDLKYVSVIESALRGDAKSHASAVGWWQFMKPSAEQFKLKVQEGLDERRDLVLSSRAGLTYLNALYDSFGSWELAMAAYNTGPGRLRQAIKTQNKASFWSLDLYTEAERYAPRALAVYHVLTNLKTYDFQQATEGWEAPELVGLKLSLRPRAFMERVEVKVSSKAKRSKKRSKAKRSKAKRSKAKRSKKRTQVSYRPTKHISLNEVAQVVGLDLITFKRHNLALTGEHLPHEVSFVLWVPPTGVEALLKHLKKGLASSERVGPLYVSDPHARSERLSGLTRDADRSSALTLSRYVVRAHDSLFLISARSGVSLDELRAWNKLSASDPLREGQELRLAPP